MNLMDILTEAMSLADEEYETPEVTAFLNDAIAKINVETKSNFPFFTITDSSTEYAGFPENWQRVLLIPFLVARMKQKESSQFEYRDAYAEFNDNLMKFKTDYNIPEEFKNTGEFKSGHRLTDFSTSYWRW
jgi:hypothetical protein